MSPLVITWLLPFLFKEGHQANDHVINPAIIGGRDAVKRRYSFMAEMHLRGTFSYCGASLITRRHALTARHCTTYRDKTKYEIVMGEYDRHQVSGSEQSYRISDVIKHPSVDAAILVLSENVTLNENVTIVELATEQKPVGTWVKAMGWGQTLHKPTDSSMAQILQEVDVPIANSSVCDGPPDYLNVREHEICVGDPNRSVYTGTCHGDSGSPVIYPANSTSDDQLVQVAIVARGIQDCPRDAIYAVFVSVPSIYNWIVCFTDMLDGRNFTNSPYVDCRLFEPKTTAPSTVSHDSTTLSTELKPTESESRPSSSSLNTGRAKSTERQYSTSATDEPATKRPSTVSLGLVIPLSMVGGAVVAVLAGFGIRWCCKKARCKQGSKVDSTGTPMSQKKRPDKSTPM